MDLIEQIVLNTRSKVYEFGWGDANSKKGVRKSQIGMIFDSGVRNFQKVENRWCRVNIISCLKIWLKKSYWTKILRFMDLTEHIVLT